MTDGNAQTEVNLKREVKMKTIRKCRRVSSLGVLAFGLGLLGQAVVAVPASAAEKIKIAVPGIPPVFSTVVIYVAKGAGFFKKHGIDATIKPFNSGVAAAKAVVSGAVEASLSPTVPVSKMISNGGVPLVALWGMERPDWLIGSMDPKKSKCADMKGQAVGVDSPHGARWIQLANMARVCKLRPDKHIPTVNLSSNVGAAMVAGRLTFGVLHRDDIAVIERESGKKLTIVSELEKVAPGTHYLMLIATKKTVKEKRATMVKVVAAMIEAVKFMQDPANVEKVAKMAKPTGRKIGDAKAAVTDFVAFKYWPVGHDGLNAKRLKKTIAIQVKVGKKTKGKAGIKPDKKAVTVDEFVDRSIFKEAMSMAK